LNYLEALVSDFGYLARMRARERMIPSGMSMLRAISRKPMPGARAVLICSQRSDELCYAPLPSLVAIVRFRARSRSTEQLRCLREKTSAKLSPTKLVVQMCEFVLA
jgi:hypothetical protein